jgi:hypothetical protein
MYDVLMYIHAALPLCALLSLLVIPGIMIHGSGDPGMPDIVYRVVGRSGIPLWDQIRGPLCAPKVHTNGRITMYTNGYA